MIVSVVLLSSFWLVVNRREFTPLESYFLQILITLVGLAGSFYSGRQSAREAAREIVNTHARPAFRRLLSLHSGLLHLSIAIESSQEFKSREDYRVILAELSGLVFMQQLTVVHALGDWEDIVPDEVKKLKEQLSTGSMTGDKQ